MSPTVHNWLFVVLITVTGLVSSTVAAQSITYQWTDIPLDVDLQVGLERNIHIPEANSVRIGIPASIDDLLNTQIIGNHIWLEALAEFDSTRVIVMAPPMGRIILQVQSRNSESSNQPIIIQNGKVESDLSSIKPPPSHGFVALTRWVVQQFYAPKRLIKELPGVVRSTVDKTPVNIFRCGMRIPTACAGALESVPLASWRSSHHFVTALHVTNNLSESVVLDPRELRGPWRTAAFLHARLHPNGHYGDSTLLILISDFPFEDPSN